MYDIDYKTSNSSIIKPFQRIFLKIIHQIHKRPLLLFYLNTTTHWQIAVHLYKRKKRPSDWIASKYCLFSGVFIRIKTIYNTNLFLKYCSLSDFIIAVIGKSDRCEIKGVWNLFPTPSLKLGSDWDSRLNPPPLTAIIRTSVVFSHTTTIQSQIELHLYKKRDLRIL